MDRTRKEAKKLMPSDGYNDDGVWGEAAGSQNSTAGGAGRAGVTTRKNPRKKEDKDMVAFDGAMPSGATTKSKKRTPRRKAQKTKTVAKAYQSPFADKGSRRRKKKSKSHTVTPEASAPAGAATPAVAGRSVTSTGRGKGKAKSDGKVVKAQRTRTISKGKGKATTEQPANKKGKGRKRRSGKEKAADTPNNLTMETKDSGEDLVLRDLEVLDFGRLEMIAEAASRLGLGNSSAEGGGSDSRGSSAEGGGLTANGLLSSGYLDMLAEEVDRQEPMGVGAGEGSDASGNSASGGEGPVDVGAGGNSAAGGGSSGWGEDDDEL